MTVFQRCKIIIYGIVQLALGIVMLAIPEYGTRLVLLIFAIYLTLMGLRNILYYLLMARFMVDGRLILIQGAIMVDFGLLAGSLTDVPRLYIILYLIIMHAFSGLLELFRAQEEKRFGAKHWKLNSLHGIINLVIVVLCVIFIKNASMTVLIFALGLIYSAIMRVIRGFRNSAFLYVQ